eukprot:6361140-Prymnesium_polylepis.1
MDAAAGGQIQRAMDACGRRTRQPSLGRCPREGGVVSDSCTVRMRAHAHDGGLASGEKGCGRNRMATVKGFLPPKERADAEPVTCKYVCCHVHGCTIGT